MDQKESALLQESAVRILEVARVNLNYALAGMAHLKSLVEDQQHRIDTLEDVISELSKYE